MNLQNFIIFLNSIGHIKWLLLTILMLLGYYAFKKINILFRKTGKKFKTLIRKSEGFSPHNFNYQKSEEKKDLRKHHLPTTKYSQNFEVTSITPLVNLKSRGR